MSQQQEPKKKKTGKSYAELLEEVEKASNVVAKVLLEQLCEALRDENPDMSYENIRTTVFIDCSKRGMGGKTGSTIYHNFPSWLIEDDPYHKRAVKMWESRHENILNLLADRLVNVIDEFPVPPVPKEDNDLSYDTKESKLDDDLPSPEELFKQATKAMDKLWKSLTNTGQLTGADTVDVLNDHIKPSREFRLRFLKGLDHMEYVQCQREFIWMEKMLQDTLKLCLEINREKTNGLTK